MDGDARKLGERLLGEIESEGLSEVCTCYYMMRCISVATDGKKRKFHATSHNLVFSSHAHLILGHLFANTVTDIRLIARTVAPTKPTTTHLRV